MGSMMKEYPAFSFLAMNLRPSDSLLSGFSFFSCLHFWRRYMTFLDTRVLFFLCCFLSEYSNRVLASLLSDLVIKVIFFPVVW